MLTTNISLLGPWAWEKMGAECWTAEGRAGIGEIDIEGNIKWAVIYDHYEGNSIQMHMAIDDRKSITRRAIRLVFEYPFITLGVSKVIGVVNSENAAALAIDFRLGFELEAIVRDVYATGDMYILSMTRDRCKWLGEAADGQLSEATAAA